MVLSSLPLEVEDRVDDVLERLGARETSVFGHVPDEKDSDPPTFGDEEKLSGNLPHLTDAARCRRELGGVDGLDGVDDEGGGAHDLDLLEDLLELGLGHEKEASSHDAQPARPAS